MAIKEEIEEINKKLGRMDKSIEDVKYLIDSIGKKDIFLIWFSVISALGVRELINIALGSSIDPLIKFIIIVVGSALMIRISFPYFLRFFNWLFRI